MELTLDINQLNKMLTDASELAAEKVIIKMGLGKPFISQNQAWKVYGRRTVERWIEEGLIEPTKDGTSTSNIRLDRMQLETLSKTSNRHTYLSVAERK